MTLNIKSSMISAPRQEFWDIPVLRKIILIKFKKSNVNWLLMFLALSVFSIKHFTCSSAGFHHFMVCIWRFCKCLRTSSSWKFSNCLKRAMWFFQYQTWFLHITSIVPFLTFLYSLTADTSFLRFSKTLS